MSPILCPPRCFKSSQLVVMMCPRFWAPNLSISVIYLLMDVLKEVFFRK